MDAYEELRKQAAGKMDKAILSARNEYRAAVDKINELRSALGDEKPTNGLRVLKTATQLVKELHPHDRAFTILDVVKVLEAAEPDRSFTRSAIKSAIHKMGERGELRRIAKDKQGHVLWADAGCEVEEKPFGAMPMSDVIADVLEGSEGMRAAEIVVAVQRIGYRAEDDPKELLRTVRKSLYANPKRFSNGGEGVWGGLRVWSK